MAYIDGEGRPSDSSAAQCPFCAAPGKDDATGLIVHRGELSFVVMNLFPYSPGHVLVCPYRHIADLTELTADESGEIDTLTKEAMRTLRRVNAPAGFNLGINQGQVAGAGIAAHLHRHVVPRWFGDANFFPIVGRTKAMPELLDDTRRKLADAWGSAS
jgi:ATP adenylyltransferase